MGRSIPYDGRKVYRKAASVLAREIDGETFLVPVEEGIARLHRLFALNAVGALIWDEIDGRQDLAAIHCRLLERFEVSADEARGDLREYVAHLEEAGLIVSSS